MTIRQQILDDGYAERLDAVREAAATVERAAVELESARDALMTLIAAALDQGTPMTAIAQQVGVSRQTLYRWLDEAGKR